MRADRVLLVGAGGHARACIDVAEQEGRFSIGGLLGLPEERGRQLLGYPILGTDDDLESMAREFGHALVAVGQIKSPVARMRLFEAVQRTGIALPTIVSPRAYVSRHARIGEGTIIMHGAVVNAGAVVGRNCILNSQSLVEHDVVVADHCHVSTRAAVNSGVHVGEGSFIGSGATVRQGVTVGARCVVGMGQRVLGDCAPGSQLPPRRAS